MPSGDVKTADEWETTQSCRGASALNPNSLRVNLRGAPPADKSVGQSLILRVVEETISKVSDPLQHAKPHRRWELGSAWINHLREEFEKKNEKSTNRKSAAKHSSSAQVFNSIYIRTCIHVSNLCRMHLYDLRRGQNHQKQRGAEPSLPQRKGNHRQDDKTSLPSRTKDEADGLADNADIRAKLGEKTIATMKDIECDIWNMSIPELQKASEQFYNDVSTGNVGEDLGALGTSVKRSNLQCQYCCFSLSFSLPKHVVLQIILHACLSREEEKFTPLISLSLSHSLTLSLPPLFFFFWVLCLFLNGQS